MHIILKAMKLFSLPLICIIILPSLFAFQAHDQNLGYTHPAIVVKDGVSYISAQTVPAGTPITSSSYWTPLLSTAPTDEPGDPPTTEPDTSDSDLGNLTPPEDNTTLGGIGQVAIDDPDYSLPTNIGTRIVNISTRGKVVGSENIDALVGGFVVRGTPGSTIKLIIRGLGPYMSYAIDSSLLLSDPYIEVYNNQGVIIARNDNWKEQFTTDDPDPLTTLNNGAYAGFTTAFAGVGLDDKEAGLLLELPIGSDGMGVFSVYLKGISGQTGIGQIAIDDPEYSENGTTNRIVNISTRGFVGTGNDEDLIGGFVLRGSPNASKNFIIRGLGPYMSYAIESNLLVPNPFMEVYDSLNQIIARNDNWKVQYSENDPNPATSLNNGSYGGFTSSFAGVGLDDLEAGVLMNLSISSDGMGVFSNVVKYSAP
jgi:hypothetical protein